MDEGAFVDPVCVRYNGIARSSAALQSRPQKGSLVVADWAPWLPIFLSENVQLPSPGSRPYIDQGDLYVLQTDTNGRLIATSLISVGSVFWIAVGAAATFVISSAIAWGQSTVLARVLCSENRMFMCGSTLTPA